MSPSPRASPYRRQSSQPRNPQGSQRLRSRSPHLPRLRNRRPAAPSISATGSSSSPLPAGSSRSPARTWRSCPTERASFSASRCRSRSPLTLPSCAMPGTGMSPRARPTASSRIPKDANVGTSSLKAATCVAEVTVSGGQGTTKLFLFSLASVRQSDGVTVIGTTYFTPNADTDQLNKDFTSMVNSMLESQVAGG